LNLYNDRHSRPIVTKYKWRYYKNGKVYIGIIPFHVPSTEIYPGEFTGYSNRESLQQPINIGRNDVCFYIFGVYVI